MSDTLHKRFKWQTKGVSNLRMAFDNWYTRYPKLVIFVIKKNKA